MSRTPTAATPVSRARRTASSAAAVRVTGPGARSACRTAAATVVASRRIRGQAGPQRRDGADGLAHDHRVRQVLGIEDGDNVTVEVPDDSGAPSHSHNCDEHVTVLEGEAEVWVDGVVTRLERFDTTYIPSPVPHLFRNVGDTPLRILWVYSSGHVTRTFGDGEDGGASFRRGPDGLTCYGTTSARRRTRGPVRCRARGAGVSRR
ncbi:cupin domain-containing protein [Streptomyces sp. Ru62]|uniref:cupin domain-containing protein n=1 Tax=Streptomyces sp. Ru62 TaxID=2080745 RepID=UPI0021560352|nr:cupin domain-containing protein [Streptomyces sp. Ru62]